jgi:formate dehydrogenase subunit gamma
MEDKNKSRDKIDEEVERRLKDKLNELESQIRQQVTEEFSEKQEGDEQAHESLEIMEKREPTKEVLKEKKEDNYFIRFGVNFRFQHIVLLTSTIMLILTGVPLKFPKNGISQFIFSGFGGAAGARSVHHFFALGLIFIGIYHLFYTFWSKQGRKDFFELLPNFKDVKDVINQIKYYLGFRKEKVKYGRFSYVEKFDYWAVYWGLIMMIGTGAIMWFFLGKFEPVIFGEINLSFGPSLITKTVYDIARAMHSDEALLATLVIIGWHFYNVHLNPHKFPMSKVWLNGKLSEKEMIEEHPLEYEEIMKQRKEKELREKELSEKVASVKENEN